MTDEREQIPGVQLRPMGIGEILDGAVRLYRQNFLLFFGVTAVVHVPLTLLMMYLTSEKQYEMVMLLPEMAQSNGSPDAALDVLRRMIGILGSLVLYSAPLQLVFQPMATGALLIAANRRLQGQPTTILGAYSALWTLFWGFFVAVLLAGLAWALGLFFCIAPGVIVAIMFALTAEAAIVERRGGTRAIGRAVELARNEWGKIFLLGLILWVLIWVFSWGTNQLSELIFGVDIDDPDSVTITGIAITTFVAGLTQILTIPFWGVAWLMLFYDVKVRKEGYDIEVMAKALEQALPPAEPPAPGGDLPPPIEPGGGRGPEA